MYTYDRRAAAAPQGLQNIVETLKDLRELDQNLDEIETTFSMHFHTAATKTGAGIDPTVKTQLDVLSKAMEGLKAAQAAQKSTAQILELYPEEKTALRAKKDAETMVARFEKHAEAARKIVRTISSKQMPPALKKLGEAAGKIIADRLVDPSQFHIFPWLNESWEHNAVYWVILRVESPDLKNFARGRAEVTLQVDSGSTRGITVSRGDNLGRTDEAPSPKVVADLMFKLLTGWSGMKGEAEATQARSTDADQIARILSGVVQRLGFDHRPAEKSEDLREINAEFRSHTLPKEGASSVGEYEYDALVRKEVADARMAVERALFSYKSKIDNIRIHAGEKSWVYIEVTLK